MRRRSKIAVAVFAVLLVGVIVWSVRTLVWLNAFRTITPHFGGRCQEVLGVVGAEDVEVDEAAAVAYLSATDRHALRSGASRRAGADGIYRLALEGLAEEDVTPQYLPARGIEDFHPHGIDLVPLADGGLRLFAVNHDRSGHSVEIFRVEDDRLVHLETVRDALIFSPNDVVGLGPRSFYVTNDRAQPRVGGVRQILRDIVLRNSPTTVVHWDGGTATVAATDIEGANGIALSADGSEVYVAASLGDELLVFTRDEKERLTPRERIPLGSSPDNVSIGADGRLLVAAHPSLFQILRARRTTPWELMPSQVLAISPAAAGEGRVEEVYMNRGEEISNVTVAAPVGESGFVMGNAFDEGVLVCRSAASRVE